MLKTIHALPALCACVLLSAPAFAQELPTAGTPAAGGPAGGGLSLELNALKPVDNGCQITFLASNKLSSGLDRLTYEFAFFDDSETIDRLLAVDFKGLAAGKTKVIQFPLDGLACDNISRVLINNAAACEGSGITPAVCLDQLATSTKPPVTFGI